MVLFFKRVNWGVGPAVDDPKAAPPCELAAPAVGPPLELPKPVGGPVLDPAPRPAPRPFAAGVDVAGAAFEVEEGNRLGAAVAAVAAVVLGVEVEDAAGAGLFSPPNRLGVV